MNAGRKLAKNHLQMLFSEENCIGRENLGADLWSVGCSVVMPGAGRALLITAETRAIVMMHRGKNRAHAHVEQANDSRYPAPHHRSGTKLRAGSCESKRIQRGEAPLASGGTGDPRRLFVTSFARLGTTWNRGGDLFP
jgi:hypothetical protein